MIYDNIFHTVQDGHTDNESVGDYIWNNLVTENTTSENVVYQVEHRERFQNAHVPQLHID